MQHRIPNDLATSDFPDSFTGFNVPGTGHLLAWGVTVPADAATGYATGCLFLHTDGGDATALYVNEGDTTSADFNAVTVA